MQTDPIADLLTRIRNAIHAKHDLVEIPYSKIKFELSKILEQEGYVRSVTQVADGVKARIQIALKYTPSKEPVIGNLRRVSKPGRRIYVGYREIKSVLGGMGLSVISTSRGLLTDKQAKENKTGGELLCTIW